MTLLGALLKNRRAGDTHSAWNAPNLVGPEVLTVTSQHFAEGAAIPAEHAGKRIGGKNLSPHLAWTPPPASTAQLLLVVEDLDVPMPKPAVHCLVLIDPSRLETYNQLDPGALSAQKPATGVRVLRSTVGRGYHGPEPIKGHGPHRYTFQLFALTAPLGETSVGRALDKARPRALIRAITTEVVARGRLTGTFER
jgi:phosphatidylethanolamine-binding protein (PEBP) family uncharacterized protein